MRRFFILFSSYDLFSALKGKTEFGKSAVSCYILVSYKVSKPNTCNVNPMCKNGLHSSSLMVLFAFVALNQWTEMIFLFFYQCVSSFFAAEHLGFQSARI